MLSQTNNTEHIAYVAFDGAERKAAFTINTPKHVAAFTIK